MGLDIYGAWHYQLADSRYEELNPGESEQAGDLKDWGHNSVLFQFLGLANDRLPQVTPVTQTEVPA